MIDPIRVKQLLDPIVDAPMTSYTISASLISLGITLDGIQTLLGIAMSIVGITVGYYRIRFERRQLAKLDREEGE